MIIIQGSSRSNGETRKSIQMIVGENDIPIVDLKTMNISGYDYDNLNERDDYISLMERVVQHDLIVLATPVYWYSMSALMKIFIDRLSDLTSIRKDIGRKLRGKKLFIIASFNTSLPQGFEDPFSQTCSYLGMTYLGCSYIYHGEDHALQNFSKQETEKAQQLLSPFFVSTSSLND